MADILTYDDEELVAATVDERNWRGIGISLLVIAAILSLIGLAIFLLTPPNEIDNLGVHRLKLNEVIQSVFQIKPFKIEWLSDNELLCHDSDGNVKLIRIDKNFTLKSLIHSSIINRFDINRIKLSPNKQLILLESFKKHDYHYTITCQYYIYNISSEVVIPLKENLLKNIFESKKENSKKELSDNFFLQNVNWGPNGTNLLIIINNDIYFINEINTDIEKTNFERLTFNGYPSIVYNGIANLMYSKFLDKVNYKNNELGHELSLSTYWWSIDGQFLLYLSINDSLVNQNTINYYSIVQDNYSSNLPKTQEIRYPLPGKLNSVINFYVQQFVTGNKPIKKQISVKLPLDLINKDFYIVDIQWTIENDILLFFVLRSFNNSIIVYCKSDSNFLCKTIMRLPTVRGSFSMSDFSSSFLKNKKNHSLPKLFFLRFPQYDAKNGLYNHVATFDLKNSYLNYITHGSFNIHKILAFDNKTESLYLIASKPDQFESKNIYELNYSLNKRSHKDLKCLTCNKAQQFSNFNKIKNSFSDQNVEENLNEQINVKKDYQFFNETFEKIKTKKHEKSNKCENFDVSFSSEFSYFVLKCNGPVVPYFELWQNKPIRKKVLDLNKNIQLEKNLSEKRLPKENFLIIPIPNSKKEAYVHLYIPPPYTKAERENVEEEGLEILYPLLVEAVSLDAYNKPKINNDYQITWPHYLASKRELIYAKIVFNHLNHEDLSIENKSNYSIKKKKSYFGKTMSDSLDKIFKDQLNVIQYLIDNLTNVNSKRVLILGWGSSGYTAIGSLSKDKKNILNGAIAIAPITNWRLIDSITAEYNLGFPLKAEDYAILEKENLIYKRSSLIHKKILLIHGTADEIVPVQQTMQLVKSFITDYEHNQNNLINYQVQLYPDENHKLSNFQHHMYLLIENFIDQFFPLPRHNPYYDKFQKNYK